MDGKILTHIKDTDIVTDEDGRYVIEVVADSATSATSGAINVLQPGSTRRNLINDVLHSDLRRGFVALRTWVPLRTADGGVQVPTISVHPDGSDPVETCDIHENEVFAPVRYVPSSMETTFSNLIASVGFVSVSIVLPILHFA